MNFHFLSLQYISLTPCFFRRHQLHILCWHFSESVDIPLSWNPCGNFSLKSWWLTQFSPGLIANSDGIALPNKSTIKRLKEGDSYKYLGVILPHETKHHEINEKVKTEHYRPVRIILERKLNCGNIITVIYTWAISLLRYSAAFLDWTGAELEQMDRRTRKLMTMHWALNPKSDKDIIS